MATYTFTGAGVYPAPNGGPQIGPDIAGGTLNDDGGDGYTTGETLGTFSGNNVTYVGTYTLAGNTYPVGTFGGGGQLVVFFEGIPVVPDISLAGTISPGATFTPCFLAGTEIATADGAALVEELAIGDMVRTFDGRDVAVKWVGSKTVSTKFGPAQRLLPVRIAAGALGENVPSKDLVVTADHALLIGDTLCHAVALVNGTTITRADDLGETFTVYHVETEGHEVIVANGAAAETFIDNMARTAFDNFAEFDELYGDVAEMEELSYPRAQTSRQVPAAIKAALAAEKVA